MKSLLEALQWRYATQIFRPEPIPENDLQAILEAGRLAPSSMNIQPWKFFVVQDTQLREALYTAGFKQESIKQAPHLIVLATRTELTQADAERVIKATKTTRGVTEEDVAGYRSMVESYVEKKSPSEAKHWNERQSYIALGFMLMMAAERGVDAGPMEGFSIDEVNKILHLPSQGYSALTLLALGYRDESDPYAHRDKVRFDMEEVVERR